MAKKKQENLVQLIKSRTWRLNNLYHIRPKEGSSLIPFRLNWAQRELYSNIWNRVIVLKARQNIFLERDKCINFANKNRMFLTVK